MYIKILKEESKVIFMQEFMFTDKRQFSFKNILKRFAKRFVVEFYIKLKLILRTITYQACMFGKLIIL